MSIRNAEIAIVKASLADKSRWDTYVDTHPDASPFHRFSWQQAVFNAYHHSIAGVMAIDKTSQQIVGVFPAILMTIPFSGKHLCSLPYCDLGFGVADSSEILDEMQQHLIQSQATLKSRFFENRGINKTTQDSGALTGQKVRMVLALPESSEALMTSFKSKLRSQIRKAEKNGLTVKLGTASEYIEWFYQIYARNMRDLGSPTHSKRWFEAIINAYEDNALISVVFNNEAPIGAGLILKNSNAVCIPWASTLREQNHLAPNMLLYWSLLEHCADNNIKHFDFGRSTYQEGTYRFKKQWGAEPQLLAWQKFTPQGQIIMQAQGEGSSGKLRELIENTWRKLPLGLTIKVGATVRPYISL